MAKGDHLSAARGLYTHHAIDLGDGRVIHYSGTASEKQNAEVRLDPYEAFVDGCHVLVVEYSNSHSADEVIRRALSRLAEHRYDLMFNNCEHFARWCKTGDSASEQVRDATATVGGVGAGGAVVAGSLGVVSATGAAAGLSGAGIMSGLAAVGGTAVGGLAVLAAAPAAVTTVAMRRVLADDSSLPQAERDARQTGRVATAVGGAVGTAGAIGAVSVAGVSGLSAAGITSGLAAIGGVVGGGMAAGTAIVIAAPAVAAAGIGYAAYRWLKK